MTIIGRPRRRLPTDARGCATKQSVGPADVQDDRASGAPDNVAWAKLKGFADRMAIFLASADAAAPYTRILEFMKNLLVIRHAKSSWQDSELADYDRPLNARGQRDAPFMGEQLKQRSLKPDLLLSSPAHRAAETAVLIAGAVGYNPSAIDFRREIYLAKTSYLMELVQGLDDAFERVFLIGHNPDITSLANRLSGESLAEMPTCGIANIEFAVDSWQEIMDGAGTLKFFDYPKRYR